MECHENHEVIFVFQKLQRISWLGDQLLAAYGERFSVVLYG